MDIVTLHQQQLLMQHIVYKLLLHPWIYELNLLLLLVATIQYEGGHASQSSTETAIIGKPSRHIEYTFLV